MKLLTAAKKYISTHKRILFILYFPFYMVWFTALERWTDRNFTVLHCPLDDGIPFVNWFIIPYYIWFVYVGVSVALFYFCEKPENTVRLYTALVTGMTITLLIYTVWPNAVSLRPADVENKGLLAPLVDKLYKIDTDTNVCPSLHVLNTLFVTKAYMEGTLLKKKPAIKTLLVILSYLIIVSTLFLKQHSFIDIAAAFGLYIAVTAFIYNPNWFKDKKENDGAAGPADNQNSN